MGLETRHILIGAALVGAVSLILGNQDPHALVIGGDVHPDFDTSIPDLETLTEFSLDQKINALLAFEEKTQYLLDQMLEVAPEGSAHVARLEHMVAFCQTMHLELEGLRDELEELDGLVKNGAPQGDIDALKQNIRERLENMKAGGYTLSLEDWQKLGDQLESEQGFYEQGRPGDVMVIDPDTEREAWVRLSTLIPCDDDAALDMLPPSTGRKLLDFTSVPGVGDVEVTEGYPANGKHLPNGDHGSGAGVDLVPADRDFTPQRIAAMLVGADDVGARAFFEAPEISDELKREIAAVLRDEYGMSKTEAASYVASHTLSGGNAPHIHFRVPGTPTQALAG